MAAMIDGHKKNENAAAKVNEIMVDLDIEITRLTGQTQKISYFVPVGG